VAIIGLFVVMGLRSLRIARQRWILFLAPVLIGYTLATGASGSAVRACVMGIAYFLAPFLGRKSDVYSAIALSALLILSVDPAQFYDIGCILSFVVVAGLILLYPYAEIPFRGLFRTDPMISPRVASLAPSWSSRVIQWTGRYLCSLTAVSVAAWLTSLPLTAYLFGRFSPVALVCNIVVIPLNFFIVLSGCLAIVIGPCVSWVADIFNHASLLLMYVTVRIMELLMEIPGGNFHDVYFPEWAVWAWYGAIGIVLVWVTPRLRGGENSCGSGDDVLVLPR
jgi:competence protein ComEC